MFGSHLSVVGGLHKALLAAGAAGLDCVQVFTRNQVRWAAKPLHADELAKWAAARAETGVARVVSHGSYLINLAGPDAALRRKSTNALRAELKRCEALGIPLAVIHPGSPKDSGEAAGIKRIAKALDRLARDLPGFAVVTCLETTAGQGAALGRTFEQLRRILDSVAEPSRLGICLDTAHMHAAGYDLGSAAGAKAVLAECDAVLGIDRVRVVHVNDSKTARGSRVDRHEHIGHGQLSLAAFRVLVNHPHIRATPKILETPKKTAPDGREWDEVNLEVLRGLT